MKNIVPGILFVSLALILIWQHATTHRFQSENEAFSAQIQSLSNSFSVQIQSLKTQLDQCSLSNQMALVAVSSTWQTNLNEEIAACKLWTLLRDGNFCSKDEGDTMYRQIMDIEAQAKADEAKETEDIHATHDLIYEFATPH